MAHEGVAAGARGCAALPVCPQGRNAAFPTDGDLGASLTSVGQSLKFHQSSPALTPPLDKSPRMWDKASAGRVDLVRGRTLSQPPSHPPRFLRNPKQNQQPTASRKHLRDAVGQRDDSHIPSNKEHAMAEITLTEAQREAIKDVIAANTIWTDKDCLVWQGEVDKKGVPTDIAVATDLPMAKPAKWMHAAHTGRFLDPKLWWVTKWCLNPKCCNPEHFAVKPSMFANKRPMTNSKNKPGYISRRWAYGK